MRIWISIALLVVASCCHEKPTPVCPTLPAREVSAPVVAVPVEQAPCVVPPKPDDIELGAMPAKDGANALVPIGNLKLLVVWIVAERARAAALEACVGARAQ